MTPQAVHLKRGGHEPAPLGAVVIRTEQVGTPDVPGRRRTIQSRYIKVRMEGPSGLRWMLYARWWWEKNRGAVPKGMMVLRRNGDTMDDSPENLFLGTAGDKIRLAHALDPEMSRRNREACREGTRRFNRLSARIARLQRPIQNLWYPVVDDVMVVIDLPNRSRRALLFAFGADVSALSKNGRGDAYASAGERVGIRLVRGRDLKTGMLGAYLRIDPATGVGIGERVRVVSREVRHFMKTALWARAVAASEIPAKQLMARVSDGIRDVQSDRGRDR